MTYPILIKMACRSLQMKNFDPLNDVTATQLCLATADLYIQVRIWKEYGQSFLRYYSWIWLVLEFSIFVITRRL